MLKKGVFLCAIASLALSAFASTKGHLVIKVSDQSGEALPGATVTVANDLNATNRVAVTDEKGDAYVRQLAPATNYAVTVVMPGFGTVKREGIRVSIDQTFTVALTLEPNMSEEMIVTGDRPIVDQSTQVTGDFLELGLIESLPTNRSYQDYLQLVTGVLPTNSDNPASKGGLNYSDIGGTQGTSRDNFYYIDGINTTDFVAGTTGATFNSEIIAEQQVMTGGMGAEYEGAPGLISNVVTKSGSNDFSGSLNYYLQNDSLVGNTDADVIGGVSEYDTFDTAVVLSGPIIRDQLFFLASYQKKEFDELVNVIDSADRSSVDEADYLYFKMTWAPTQKDSLEFIYSEDPRTISASNNPEVINNRSNARELGGERISINYNRLINDSLDFEAKLGFIESQVLRNPSPGQDSLGSNNDIRWGDIDHTTEQEQLGGYDFVGEDDRNRDSWSAKLTYYVDTASFGSHEIKFGLGGVDNQNVVREYYPSGAHYESAALATGASTYSELAALGIFSDTDFSRIASAINDSYAALIPTLDANGDGIVSTEEVAAAPAGFVNGNPHGQINAYRIFENNAGVNDLQSEGFHIFLQDNITWGRFNANLGVRLEEFEHFSATGESIHKFDMEVAPRLGLSYDVQGDGRQKAWAFYGRYYDPVRGNMTDFAGAWTGWERFEQAYIGGEWVTFRVRGGGTNIDALFAPTTKTPYTDELTFGYQTDLGNGMSLEVSYTDRQTENILEDYDITPYSFVAEGQGYYTDPNLVGVYALDLDYFGYSYQDLLANPSNYVIATLAGGKREYTGIDVTFRKAMSNNWSMLASYTNGDAKGNTNSDSNADLQGDLEQLDPRVPGMFARQPGSIEHIFKVAGSYRWDNGLEVGGFYKWNSGLYYTTSEYFYRRYVPVGWSGVDVQDAASGIPDGTIGANQTPAYGTLDLRVAYKHQFSNINTEFFLDVFNALDDQAVTAEEGRIDAPSLQPGDAKDWVLPQRFYLGARVSF